MPTGARPTAARLVAGLALAAVAWLTAHLYALALPEGQQAGLVREICAGLGLVIGWRVLGGFLDQRRGRVEAMGTGLRAALTVALSALILFALREVALRAIDGRYRDPMQAVLDVFSRILHLGAGMLRADVMAALLLGGLLGGALAHMAAARWN